MATAQQLSEDIWKLLTEIQGDDTALDAVATNVAALHTAVTDLTAQVAALTAGQPVTQVQLDAFDATLATAKTAADEIATKAAAAAK